VPPRIPRAGEAFRAVSRLGGLHFVQHCISFNIDFDGSTAHPPESYRADVEKFLNEQKADFLHVINNEPSEDFLNRIRLPGPPAVFVYGPTGELARRFDNSASKDAAFTYEKDVIPLVESLLADP